MVRFYLYFNAALYFLFALWCTIAPLDTSQQLGYSTLTPAGLSEYLVVYGGIELGLGVFFLYCARRETRTGILFSLALYAPIVLFRWISIARLWPVSMATVTIGALETLLLLAALILCRSSQQSSIH